MQRSADRRHLPLMRAPLKTDTVTHVDSQSFKIQWSLIATFPQDLNKRLFIYFTINVVDYKLQNREIYVIEVK